MRVAALCFIAAVTAAAVFAEDVRPVTLHLHDGSVIVGIITKEADGAVTIETRHMGTLTIDAGMVVERIAGAPVTDQPSHPVAPPPTPPVPAPSPATPAVTWTRTFTVGGSYASAPYRQGELEGNVPGVSGKALRLPGTQINAQTSLSVLRVAPQSAWWISGSVTYVDAKPAGKLTEAFAAETEYKWTLRNNLYLFTSTTFKRDEVRRIDNSVVQMVGVGKQVVDRPNLKVNLLPGVLVQRQESGTRYDEDILAGYGFIESAEFNTKKGAALEQRLSLRTLLEDADLWAMESYTGLRAPLTRHLAVMLGVTVHHDEMLGLQKTIIPAGALFPGSPLAELFANDKTTVNLTTGVQFRY